MVIGRVCSETIIDPSGERVGKSGKRVGMLTETVVPDPVFMIIGGIVTPPVVLFNCWAPMTEEKFWIGIMSSPIKSARLIFEVNNVVFRAMESS